MNPPLTQLDLHPLRAELYNELHSRPFHVLPCPAQVTHIALLTTPEQRSAQQQAGALTKPRRATHLRCSHGFYSGSGRPLSEELALDFLRFALRELRPRRLQGRLGQDRLARGRVALPQLLAESPDALRGEVHLQTRSGSSGLQWPEHA